MNPCPSDAGVSATSPTPVLDDSEFGASGEGQQLPQSPRSAYSSSGLTWEPDVRSSALHLRSLDLRLSRRLGARHKA